MPSFDCLQNEGSYWMHTPYCVVLATTLLLSSVAGHADNGARLTGTVEDPTSTPIAGASVTLVSVDAMFKTDTLPDGSFAFDDISPGAYELKVEILGWFREKLSLDIHENTAPVPLVIRPKICMGTSERVCGPDFPVTYGPPGTANSHLKGVVYHVGGPQPIADADITIQRIDHIRPPLRSRSDRTGSFSFEDVPAGVYDLKVAKRGYQPVEVKRLIKPRGHDVFIQASILERGIVIVEQ
ncbi:MAG TPA: carboxypeptidase-like regulatory domain-containing protein [Bryobacteraceae bacterium]|nr:carboxypeptidase-like regulatory domain-containing protein [Bryobacteraceae bacterium]